VEAIRMVEQHAGRWFLSDTRFGPLFHAHLYAGQENSGKLVTTVKQHARLLALDTDATLLLVDGPPGIGCPVISASAGADLALLVIEPTISGVHDMKRVLATTDHFRVPAMVVINKADLNHARCAEIAAFCTGQGIDLIGQIPYDTVVTKAMVAGEPVTSFADGPVSRSVGQVWAAIRERLNGGAST
jgi:MinD superfamily P-loop ATPase